MTVFHNQNRWDTSNVQFEGGRILAYNKKIRTPEMRYIDYGLGAFHYTAFDDVPQQGAYDLAELYQNLFKRGELAGFEVSQRFYEAGSFAGIQELARLLAEGKANQT